MWLYLVAIVLVVMGLVGAFAGGIFTLVLIPIALIILVAGSFLRGGAEVVERRGGGGADSDPPYPASSAEDPGHVPTSPEALTDARRAQQ